MLYPPDQTHVLQPVDRHIGIQYKTAIYKAVRAKSMQLMRESEGSDIFRMKPLEKRVLMTKIVADTHERLARNGTFERAFVATGTWLPLDHSADTKVDLQGVNIKYEHIITPIAIEAHRKLCEEKKLKEDAEQEKRKRIAKEKEEAIIERLAPAVERSSAF